MDVARVDVNNKILLIIVIKIATDFMGWVALGSWRLSICSTLFFTFFHPYRGWKTQNTPMVDACSPMAEG